MCSRKLIELNFGTGPINCGLVHFFLTWGIQRTQSKTEIQSFNVQYLMYLVQPWISYALRDLQALNFHP